MNLPPQLRQAGVILIVGGTFDPPHAAHLKQAQIAAAQVHADALLYIPAGKPPQKQNIAGQASPEDRLAMVRLLIQDCPNAFVCTFELDRQHDPAWAGKPSYSVDTLQALRDELDDVVDDGLRDPSAVSAQLRLLIGSDQAANFHTWHEYERLMALADPAVMPRLPWTADSLIEHIALTQSPQQADQWRSRLIDMPVMNTSSTEIRQRIKKGLAIDEMVSPLIEAYIRKHALYAKG